ESFVGTHVSWTGKFNLPASVDRVFPLFTPLGEKHWAEGWNPHMCFPESGLPEVGVVFTTEHPGESLTTWVIAQYAPENGLISYARFAQDSHAGLITVQCRQLEESLTNVIVTYTLTALTESGNVYLTHLDEAHYKGWMVSWETAIKHFLEHG